MKVTVRQFDEHLGVLLPDELIASLGWEPGDVLEVGVENGALNIVRVQKGSERGVQIADELMDEYHETLQALAKS